MLSSRNEFLSRNSEGNTRFNPALWETFKQISACRSKDTLIREMMKELGFNEDEKKMLALETIQWTHKSHRIVVKAININLKTYLSEFLVKVYIIEGDKTLWVLESDIENNGTQWLSIPSVIREAWICANAV